jgi:hypothetical protein
MSTAPRTDTAPGTPSSAAPGHSEDPVLPGSPAAVDAGCRCSVLANAAFRCGASQEPLIDPTCPVAHH